MKSKFFKALSLILCFCMFFSVMTPAVSAESKTPEFVESIKSDPEKMDTLGTFISKLLNTIVNDFLIGIISKILPNFDFVKDATAEEVFDAFYAGDEKFISTYTDRYTWRVGYGSRSILPDDFGTPYKYARGSYAPWGYSTDTYTDDDGNKEDLKVRTVILDDCTGRGLTVISSVDCIGLSNTDVLKIREALSDFAKENNVISLNVSAIHSHMSIDSQGVWNTPLLTVGNNLIANYTGLTELKHGVNEDFLETVIERTKESVLDAYADMKEGKLSYTNIELDNYFHTRTVSPECDGNIHKLMFYPLDSSRSTLIASFGAHPEVTSYDAEYDTRLSADFIYYMEKLINSAGSNFMFIQGNVGTNSVVLSTYKDSLDLADNHETAIRIGYKLAYICLSASMTKEDRIALNEKLGDRLGVKEYSGRSGYTPWYEGLGTFKEQPVEAVLNVKHSQVKLLADNSVAQILIKLGLASNYLSYDKNTGNYYTITEIGYMEFGTKLKAFLSPGEMYSELYVGGYGLRNSDYKSLREDYGDNVILFDLMNDAAGYICPDETYSTVGYKYNPATGELEEDSWCLVISIGESTASTLMAAYRELVTSSVVRE